MATNGYSTWLGRLHETVPQFPRPVAFRPVQSLDELRTASRVVYREYGNI